MASKASSEKIFVQIEQATAAMKSYGRCRARSRRRSEMLVGIVLSRIEENQPAPMPPPT